MAKTIDFSNADDVYVGDVDLSKVSVGTIPVWNEWSSLPDFAEPSPVPPAQDFALAAPIISGFRVRYHYQDAPGKVTGGLAQAITSPHADPVLGYVWQAKPSANCGGTWLNDPDWTPVDNGPSYVDSVPETDGFKNLKWVYPLAVGSYSQTTLEAGPPDSPDALFMGLKERTQYMFRCCAFTAQGYGAWSAEKELFIGESISNELIPGVGEAGTDWKVLSRTLNLSVRATTQSYPGFVIATVNQQQTSQVITGYRFQWRRIEEWGTESAWIDCTDAYPVDLDGNMTSEPSAYYVLAGIPKGVRVEVRAFSETAHGQGIIASASGEVAKKFAAPTGGPDIDARPVPDPLWPVYDSKLSCVNYGYRWVSLEPSQSRSLYVRDTLVNDGSVAGAPCDMTAPIAFFATGGSMPPGGRIVHLGRAGSTGAKSLVTADDFELFWNNHALPGIPSIPGTTINRAAYQALCWNPTLDLFLLGVWADGNPLNAGWLATAPADLSSWTVVNSWTINTNAPNAIAGPHALYPVGDKFWNATDGKHSPDGATWSGTTTPADFVRFAGQPRQEHTDGQWIVEAVINVSGTEYSVLYKSVDLNSWSQLYSFDRVGNPGFPSGSQADQIVLPDGSTGWDSRIGRRPRYNGTTCLSAGWETWTSDFAGNMIWNGNRMIGAAYTQGPDLAEVYKYTDMPVPPAECGDDWWCHLPILRRRDGMVAPASAAQTPSGKFVIRGFDLPTSSP